MVFVRNLRQGLCLWHHPLVYVHILRYCLCPQSKARVLPVASSLSLCPQSEARPSPTINGMVRVCNLRQSMSIFWDMVFAHKPKQGLCLQSEAWSESLNWGMDYVHNLRQVFLSAIWSKVFAYDLRYCLFPQSSVRFCPQPGALCVHNLRQVRCSESESRSFFLPSVWNMAYVHNLRQGLCLQSEMISLLSNICFVVDRKTLSQIAEMGPVSD